MHLTRDGCHALSGSYDRTLKLWDLQTGDLIHSFVGHTDAICAVAASPDSRRALPDPPTGRFGFGIYQPASSCIPSRSTPHR